jgi:uncharacterized small protein (DUF1192 family)
MGRSPLEQLGALGEEVFGKAAKNPTAHRVVQGASYVKDRIDELQKQLRGLQGLEERIAALEARVEQLEGGGEHPAEAADASEAS